jgi:hypothetical protein
MAGARAGASVISSAAWDGVRATPFKYVPISDFALTVERVDGGRSAQGPYWSENSSGAVSGVMGVIPIEQVKVG